MTDLADDGVVEGTAETAVAGDDDQGDLLDGADLGQGGVDILLPDLAVHAVQHLQCPS